MLQFNVSFFDVTDSFPLNFTETSNILDCSFKEVFLKKVQPELQDKTVTPTNYVQVVIPDSDYQGLSSVTVEEVPTQSKSITPSQSKQIVNPDEGLFLHSVIVNPIPHNYGLITYDGSVLTVS